MHGTVMKCLALLKLNNNNDDDDDDDNNNNKKEARPCP
jgi:hypothetical protein